MSDNIKQSQSHWFLTYPLKTFFLLFSFVTLLQRFHLKSQKITKPSQLYEDYQFIWLDFFVYSLCALHLEVAHTVLCPHYYVLLMLSCCWFIFLFFFWLFENKCESDCLSVCLSQLTSDRLLSWHHIRFTRMTAAYGFIAHYHPFKTGDYAPLIFWNLNVISKLFPCSSLILCFVHNWLLSGQPYLFEQLLGCISSHGLYSCLVEWNTAPNVLEQ